MVAKVKESCVPAEAVTAMAVVPHRHVNEVEGNGGILLWIHLGTEHAAVCCRR